MNSEQAAVKAGGLQVVADFGRSAAHLDQLKRWVEWLTPLSPALIGAGLVGWVVTLLLYWRGDQPFASTLLVLVIIVSFAAIIVPYWMENLSAEITQRIQLRTAQNQLTTLLEKYLDDEWTLYHQFPIGNETVSLLVGTRGVYLLDLLFSTATAQVKADKWLFRDEDGNWNVSKISPTRKATQKALRLQRRLHNEHSTLFVHPRVVWAGESVILLDEPTVPVWWLAQVEGMVKDLRQQNAEISAETIATIQTELEKIFEESRNETAIEI